jgi:hypothetical protein
VDLLTKCMRSIYPRHEKAILRLFDSFRIDSFVSIFIQRSISADFAFSTDSTETMDTDDLLLMAKLKIDDIKKLYLKFHSP